MPEIKNLIRAVKLGTAMSAMVLAAYQTAQAQENPIDTFARYTIDSANWQQGTPRIETQVETITLVHLLSFDGSSSALNNQELASLREFLRNSGVGDGARIEVDGPRASGGYFDSLTKARIEEIRAELSSLGLRSQIPEKPVSLLSKPPERIAVTVTRAMIIPPDCSAPQPEFAARPENLWSCANASNLGRMVADPVDLVRGRTLSPADGEASATAIEIYRKREVEDPTAEKTSEQ